MVLETKLDGNFLDGNFPLVQVLVDGFQQTLRFDQNKYGRDMLLRSREDIPAKLVSDDLPLIEIFYVELTFHKKKCLMNYSYNPHQNNISKHLNIISKSLDVLSSKYNYVILISGFNAEWNGTPMIYFCNSSSLKTLLDSEPNLKNTRILNIFVLYVNQPTKIISTGGCCRDKTI